MTEEVKQHVSFNPRSLHRERRTHRREAHANDTVSIHAPYIGSDGRIFHKRDSATHEKEIGLPLLTRFCLFFGITLIFVPSTHFLSLFISPLSKRLLVHFAKVMISVRLGFALLSNDNHFLQIERCLGPVMFNLKAFLTAQIVNP